MKNPIRILLVEDHILVRAGIKTLLDDLPHTEVVAEADNGREALTLLETIQPDVILMDIAMPGLNGLETTGQITKHYPHIKVIVLSMHANEAYVLRALRVGASGYLLKDASFDELERALGGVLRGEIYLSPAVSKHVVAQYLKQTETGTSTSLEQLTPRQREVLQLITEGHTNKEIASILDISVKTVETHRADLMQRLEIYDVAGLVRYAVKMGLITVDK